MRPDPEAGPDGLMEDLELARQASLDAGLAVLRAFGGPHRVRHKTADQPVTDADLAADRLIRERLTAGRPAYGWLSEETADQPDRLGKDRVWIVDPIDGTRSYIDGRPEYAISVGLAKDGVAVAGVIFNPSAGELFLAARGAGAWLQRMPASADGIRAAAAHTPLDGATRLRVSDVADPRAVRLVASRSEIRAGEIDPFTDWSVEGAGSTAWKMATVAAGRADVFLSRGPKSEWDVCGGDVIVREAGGWCSDLLGGRLVYNRRSTGVHGILATNGRLSESVIERIRTLPPTVRMRREEAASGEGGSE